LFLNTGMLGGFFHEDDVEGFQAFVAQLALLLDGADLLARTIAVERSLAHAEKLAAIGELAARIAHEIRNPVTAARSLAQQLAREPGQPWVAEHRLILEELDRVERQMGDLLRFARREELRFEPVDLGDLARGTLDALRPRPAGPADALPRLFEPFFSTKQTGTGLGLAIARHAVEAHGGAIVAAPAEGAGLTFRVTLPLAETP